MRESLSDSNRSSNLEKSSSLSSSTSSENWLLNYPFTSPDTTPSPTNKALSPSKESKFTFDKCMQKQSPAVTINVEDDDVFIIGNGIPSSQSLNKLNSLERKSVSSGRSSLGESSVMHDFVSSILDELNVDGVVKAKPGSPIKTNNRKMEIDKLNRDKGKNILQNGHCVVEMQPDLCNRDNLCNKVNKKLLEDECNSGIELRPVSRTFSLDSSGSRPRSPSRKHDVKKSDSRTNSPSRIPKATKQGAKRGTTNLIGQSLKKLTDHIGDHHNSVSGQKEKKKESKGKSRIPQLIRDGFRSAMAHAGPSRNKDRFPKVDIIRTARSLPGSPLLNRKLSPGSPKLNGSTKLRSYSTTDEPKQNGSASPGLSPSPKSSHSPLFTKSPRLCASPRMAGSPLMLSNGFSDSTDSLGGSNSWNGGHSRKSSLASSSSFVVENVPFIDDSACSSPEGQGNQNSTSTKTEKPSKKSSDMQISSPITSAYGIDITEYGFQSNITKRTNGGLDDQISPEMIEDIKHGRLASNWDSLSLGNQSKSSPQHDLKSAYSWSEDLSKAETTPEAEHRVNGIIDENDVIDEDTKDILTSSPHRVITSSPHRMECKQEAEAEPCKVQVPLVDGDMMEDFEVDDMCGDDDTGSIRENAAQLTEKVSFSISCKFVAHVIVKKSLIGREVNKNNLLGGQFLIFLPQNSGK